MSTSTPAPHRATGAQVVPALLGLVRFQHTVFALPFALAGALMARNAWPPLSVLGWILLAMVGARSLAMAINRLVDRLDLDVFGSFFAERIGQTRTTTFVLSSGKAKLGSLVRNYLLCFL